MSRTCRTTIVAGFCAALVAAQAAAAPAISQGEVISRTVKYSDADLQSPAAAGRLAARIAYAADHVCGGDSNLVRFTAGFERCRRAAVRRAAAKLDAPLVTAALGVRETELAAK